MHSYIAPIKDINFLVREVFDFESHFSSLPGCEDATPELVDAVLNESARFSENILAPLYQTGDQQGCQWENSHVVTPEGFKEAYRQYVEAGWGSMCWGREYGGQGLPPSLSLITGEFVSSANGPWSMCTGLSYGAIKTIEEHGTQEQKKLYLSKLVEGVWSGTMCLTEPQSGTDLGILSTKAVPSEDGSYKINGNKIFISFGEHDMTENIVHIVLARLPDAPKGTKGISLFLVPKYRVNPDGTLGDRNSVSCGAIEHKMGLKGSPTCVMNFDDATGYLIGSPNRGLNNMFTFMNTIRLMAAQQGITAGELSYQCAREYAKERLQMRALTGPAFPEKSADPIIVHPDVRRMLLTQKAFTEGGRAFIYYLAKLSDCERLSVTAEEKRKASGLLSLLIPIAKGFLTEVGQETVGLGLQVFGGHGYVKEWGVEQIVRDTRIATIYEGTTGVQALDLIGRKVLGSNGQLLRQFADIVRQFCHANSENEQLQKYVIELSRLVGEWQALTKQIAEDSADNPNEIGAASVDYLMYSGYLVLAYFWAEMARIAHLKLSDPANRAFYEAKINTANFYFARLLPRTHGLSKSMLAGADSLMDMPVESF